MTISLTTYLTGKDVTPTEDAIVYEFATATDGILYGCELTQRSDNQIHVNSGHGIFCGRKFTIEEEVIFVELSNLGSQKKKLILRMDLANFDEPIKFEIVKSDYVLTQQENANLINGVFEYELAAFEIGTTNITEFKQTFEALNRNWLKNSQLFKLTEDSGNAIVLVNKDLNELKEPGFYFLGDPKNAPGNLKYCFVTVVKNDNEVIQNVTGTITGRQFWRILSPNVSKKWYESATKEDVETQYLESVNCNSLNEQRMYYVINATNCFTNGYVYLFNGYCYGTSVAFQYGFDVINNKFGYRTYVQGVWKPWKTW